MSRTSAQTQFDSTPVLPAAARAFRPFGRDTLDLICIEQRGHELRPRIHNRYAIVLVPSRAVVRLESSRSIVVGPNTAVLVPPRQAHALRLHDAGARSAEQSTITLLLQPSELHGLADADRPALPSDAEASGGLWALAAQLQQPVRPLECELTIRPVIERLTAQSALVESQRQGLATQTLRAVRDYLHSHETEQVSTQVLSRYSGLTESHLIRAFHGEFGLPPHAYHLRLRLARACDLLAEGLAVSSAAYECGFADQSHLSRNFKQTYGLTPAAWANAVGVRHQAELYSSR